MEYNQFVRIIETCNNNDEKQQIIVAKEIAQLPAVEVVNLCQQAILWAYEKNDDANTILENIQMICQKYSKPEDEEISIVWSYDDIVSRAKDRGIYVHTSIAKKILSLLESEHDCNIGINWDVIDVRTDDESLENISEWDNTDMPSSFTCIDDVAKFLYILFEKYSVMYNSADAFKDMINVETFFSTFTPEKAEELELIHDKCRVICEKADWDIDELATMVQELWEAKKVD